MKIRYIQSVRAAGLLWLLSLTLLGCSTTPRSVERQQSIITAGTNAVQVVQRDIVPLLPSPFGGLVEGGCAVAVAALALWQRALHQKLAKQDPPSPSSAK